MSKRQRDGDGRHDIVALVMRTGRICLWSKRFNAFVHARFGPAIKYLKGTQASSRESKGSMARIRNAVAFHLALCTRTTGDTDGSYCLRASSPPCSLGWEKGASGHLATACGDSTRSTFPKAPLRSAPGIWIPTAVRRRRQWDSKLEQIDVARASIGHAGHMHALWRSVAL